MTPSLLLVFAHPDDETYATGATIARCASDGVRISLYCATDGGAGRSSGIPVSSPAELGLLRRDELRTAAEILGIQSVEFGGFPDGRLPVVNPDDVIGQIVAAIRRSRPDVVLTFGPEGAPTQHRDHRAISALTTMAFLFAGTDDHYTQQIVDGLPPHSPARLCHVTWPTPAPDAFYPVQGEPIHVAVDARPWNALKHRAFDAHRSQGQHRENFERYAITDSEYFSVAAGQPAPDGATDLFAGLLLDQRLDGSRER
ncbi:MAG: LmbE-like protein [Gemmatimonadetes bacterium]|nr:LmbE-like protein [Gemmatimonadota bacterium]